MGKSTERTWKVQLVPILAGLWQVLSSLEHKTSCQITIRLVSRRSYHSYMGIEKSLCLMCLACLGSGWSACFVTHGMFHGSGFAFSSKFLSHSLPPVSQVVFTQSTINVETSSISGMK